MVFAKPWKGGVEPKMVILLFFPASKTPNSVTILSEYV